jgi:hypothetical protein
LFTYQILYIYTDTADPGTDICDTDIDPGTDIGNTGIDPGTDMNMDKWIYCYKTTTGGLYGVRSVDRQ